MSTQQDKLREIANALRTKEGTTAKIPAAQFAQRILKLSNGSSVGPDIFDGVEDLAELLSLIGDGNIVNGDNWQSLDEIIALIGGDTTSAEKQLQELIELSNRTTGNKDDTVAESIESLVDGYGQGGGPRSFHFHYREALYHTDIKMMPDPCNGIIRPRPIMSIIGRYKLLVQEVQQ